MIYTLGDQQTNARSAYAIEVEWCDPFSICIEDCPLLPFRQEQFLNTQSQGECCSMWLTGEICTTVWVEMGDGSGGDSGGESGGSGGGSGGSSGGDGGWTPTGCDDGVYPARSSQTYYYPCAPGWVPVPPYNPCEEAKAGSDKATNLSNQSIYNTAKNAIQTAATDGNEQSVTFGKDASGNITSSAITTGNSNSGIVNTSWPGAFADMHNHPGNHPPSSGDFYKLIEANQNHSGYDTRFIITPNGSVYALLVIDLTAASAFVINHPSQQIPGFSPDFPDDIIDEMNEIKGFYGATEEMAMAFILDKYHAGVALLKQNSSGNFKRLITTETVDANGNKTYVANNCQ